MITEYDDYNSGVQEIKDDFNYSFCFMMNAATTLSFPFSERKALISIDSNCSRHMTGYYLLSFTQPCTIYVDGAFEQQTPGVGRCWGQ